MPKSYLSIRDANASFNLSETCLAGRCTRLHAISHCAVEAVQLMRLSRRGQTTSLLLLGDKIIHDTKIELNAFAEGIERDAFVIGVKAQIVLVGEREGEQAIGLDIV